MSATSSGLSIRSSSCCVNGIGRFFRIGVAISPGQITIDRMPFTHSDMFSWWLIATMPCLAAV